MTPTSYNSSGVVRISGVRAFGETATVLGQIFEVIFEPMERDNAGRTQSWLARRGGLQYLFQLAQETAPPATAEASENYQLSVTSTNSASGARHLEIADYLVTRIRRDGRLNCWPSYSQWVSQK